MKYEVELYSSITISVEAESEQQAKQLAKEAATDSWVHEEFGDNAEVESVEELEGMDYNSIYVDSTGSVHRQ